MTFTDRLCSLPLERLKEILRRRAFHIRSVPRIARRRELCTWMAQALSEPYAIRRAFEETDLLEGALLSYVVAQGGAVSRETIVSRAGPASADQVDAAADNLEALGLAIRLPEGEGWRLWAPDAVCKGIPLPLPVRNLLQPTLERYHTDWLYHIVSYLGITTTGLTTKAARAKAIADRLLDPDQLQSVLNRLSEEASRILDFVIRRGGVSSLHELGLRLDTRRRNQLYSYDWSYRWHATSPRNAVEELLSAGILVMEGEVGFHYGAILIAGDLLERLSGRAIISGELPEMPPLETLTPDGQPLRSHETILRDIAYFLGFLAKNATGRTGKGIIHRTALKTVSKSLTISDPAYPAYVYALVRGAGIIDPGPDETYVLTPDGEAWLDKGRIEQLRTLYEVWRLQLQWVELAPDLLMEEGMYVDTRDVGAVRETVLSILRECASSAPGELLRFSSLVARARYHRWAAFPPDPAPDESDPSFLEDESGSGITGQVLAARVIWALYWLGMVELGASPTGDLTLIRLSPLGRMVLLGEGPQDAAPESDTFVVQPNLEIYAPPSLRTRLYYGLLRLAEPKGAGMLILSKESLRKAFDRGFTASQALDFLRANSSTGLPQNVEYLVREVGGRHGHIRVGAAGLYVVVDDPILLKELAAQKKLNVHIRRQLSDTVALITGDSVDAVLKQLRQAGYLPVADREEKTSAGRRRERTVLRSAGERESAAPVLAAIPWNRLEKDEPSSPEGSGVTDREEIRDLVHTALRESRRLEYATKGNPEEGDVVTVEPVGLAGSLLRVYTPARRGFGILNLSQLRWARLTNETFEPKREPTDLFT